MMLVLYGPTTVGKTDLALSVANDYKGEIISADSRQIYKGLDIGTGKVSPGSKVVKNKGYWTVDGIKIYGFDIKKPGQRFSSVDFSHFAKTKINKIIKQGKLPIIVGGTGFYIKTLLQGFETYGIPLNHPLRKKLEYKSAGELYKKLIQINPKRAAELNESDRNNPRRLIRAIEVSITKQRKVIPKMNIDDYLIFGFTAPNDFLFNRADEWLEKRLSLGMIDEVKSLIDGGVDAQWLMGLGLEYKWVTKTLSGSIDMRDAINRLKGEIHAYIRRQKTFFKQFPTIKIIDITQKNWKNDFESQIKILLKK